MLTLKSLSTTIDADNLINDDFDRDDLTVNENNVIKKIIKMIYLIWKTGKAW